MSNHTLPSARVGFNAGWRFHRCDAAEIAAETALGLAYDLRPEITENTDGKDADAKPTEAIEMRSSGNFLKPWILPSANAFIRDPAKRHVRPDGNPGAKYTFVQADFDDASWEAITLPHDWAIKGPFQGGWDSEVGGGMGRLPSNGVGWYRKSWILPATARGQSVFLDVDGAMSYAAVWLNGHLVGGWPYGYNGWRVDLTPFARFGENNQLAIRLDNPNHSARWYPGGGLYRAVWLTLANPVHVAHWGTTVTTDAVSAESATVNLAVTVDNDGTEAADVIVTTRVYEHVKAIASESIGREVAAFEPVKLGLGSRESKTATASVILRKPRLWGPLPTQTPSLYVAVTTIERAGVTLDRCETRFGVRSIVADPNRGFIVNGERVPLRGVNQHHDLGALGAAFNLRAAERQLEALREMGCNAIRLSHNPPASELLDLTDRMGFLVIDEIFDSWERKKTPHDFHLIFPDWHEPDARAFVRRDRNHPSVFLWSFGNEVGEQYTGAEGAAIAARLRDIIRQEDPSRLTITAMNYAKPDMELPAVPDVIGLNYQGEGIRQDPEFEGTERIRTPPQYDAFHARFPDKVILSTETASAFSSRGVYLFPVSPALSAPVRDGRGGDSKLCQVSAYELHAVDFGSTADKVFGSLERHPFVAGEFVWTGWDHLGEPTPYYEARSAYCGVIDLAGFRKDRFYLYQSQWRPDLPMAHLLPHWTWPERVGEITPVHAFTSGDEAELFLNGKSLGRKRKAQYEYRLRWDEVAYEPGELVLKAYKAGKPWAEDRAVTAGPATALRATADRARIDADGLDLAFIAVRVEDTGGTLVPRASDTVAFTVSGPGELVATDNGDPTNLVSFASAERAAFNGLCLAIVRSIPGQADTIVVTAAVDGLQPATVTITAG